MAALSDRALAGYIKQSRWPARLHRIVFAVVIGESTADPTVTNSTGHKGLMQISPLHGNMPGDPYNPLDNLNMGYTIYRRQGWNAWVVYSSGKYRQYLDRADRALGNPAVVPSQPGSGVTTVGLPGSGWLSGITEFIQRLFSWQTYKNAGLIALGFLLIVLALMNMNGTSAGQAVRTAARLATRTPRRIR